MEKGYLVIDIGTGNARVGVVTAQGQVLGVKTANTSFVRDPLYYDAWQFDPLELWQKIGDLSRAVMSSKPAELEIVAVTATSAREGIVLLDSSYTAFLALPNIDNRGLAYVDTVQADAAAVYRSTGHWLSHIFSALKLVGLREKYPELYQRVAKITSISDWIGFQTTGVCVYEYSQACETQLMDIQSRTWSESLCRAFQIDPSILPQLVSAGTSLGLITQEAAAHLGLPCRCPFLVNGADTQVAVAGAGARCGDLVIVSGTTTPVVRITESSFWDVQQRCWVDCHLVPGQYLIESNAGVTGLNYQRFKELFYSDVSYLELDQAMMGKRGESCTASFGTLIFSANRSLYHGGFRLNAPLAADVDRFDFALAIVQDIAFSIAANYQNQMDILPEAAARVLGCGGGLQSNTICQTIATCIQQPLILQEGFSQASLRGCASVCSQALSLPPVTFAPKIVFDPETDNSLIKESYCRWQEFRELLNS